MDIKQLFTIRQKPFFFGALLLAATIVLWQPAGLTLSQSITLAWAIFGILGWATGFLPRQTISVLLISAFFLWGNTAPARLLTFPLSANFITIAASFLLSQGVVKSKAADQAAELLLNRWCRSSKGVVVMLCLLNLLLGLVIPQPVPRIVLLSSVAEVFAQKKGFSAAEQSAVLFSVFVSATATSMVVKNADVVLNNTALEVAGASLDQGQWLLYMTPPTLAASLVVLLLFLVVFRKALVSRFVRAESRQKVAISTETKKSALIMAAVIFFWVTESGHGISAAWVAAAGVGAMYAVKILDRWDLRAVNVELLLFLTAAFSIGSVLVDSGVAEGLTESLLGGYRPTGSAELLTAVMVLVMVIHMLVGSAVTALSVAVPVVAAVTAGGINPEVLGLTSLVLVTVQYLLPFHQLTIMVGYGRGYFTNREVLKFSLPLTVVTIGIVLLIYLPWWRLTGLM